MFANLTPGEIAAIIVVASFTLAAIGTWLTRKKPKKS